MLSHVERAFFMNINSLWIERERSNWPVETNKINTHTKQSRSETNCDMETFLASSNVLRMLHNYKAFSICYAWNLCNKNVCKEGRRKFFKCTQGRRRSRCSQGEVTYEQIDPNLRDSSSLASRIRTYGGKKEYFSDDVRRWTNWEHFWEINFWKSLILSLFLSAGFDVASSSSSAAVRSCMWARKCSHGGKWYRGIRVQGRLITTEL